MEIIPVIINSNIQLTGVITMKTKELFLTLTDIKESIILEYLSKGNRCDKDLWCKCGKPKRMRIFSFGNDIKYESLDSYCGDKKCHPTYGIKRPAHSKYMSELAASGENAAFNATLMKKGMNHNLEVNTESFKKKVLDNKEIVYSEDNFLEIYSNMLSERNKARSTRTVKMITQFTNWEKEYIDLILLVTDGINITEDWLSSLSDEKFEHIRYNIHGINTLRNSDKADIGRNSWFKSELVSDLKFNIQGLTAVMTRSGMETNYIHLFENNQVSWSYETLKLRNLNGKGFYKPDFIIKYNGTTYIIESKGSFYRTDKTEYMENKIGAGIAHAKQNGWKFCLTFEQNPTTMKFLDKTILGE